MNKRQRIVVCVIVEAGLCIKIKNIISENNKQKVPQDGTLGNPFIIFSQELVWEPILTCCFLSDKLLSRRATAFEDNP